MTTVVEVCLVNRPRWGVSYSPLEELVGKEATGGGPRVKDKAVVEEVRRRNDIVEVISEYVALKKRGRDYLGLCPFHHEKTPSFHVSPDKGLFYCFGCQAGGNVFTFIQKRENLTFSEALKLLADRTGISLEDEGDLEARRRRQETEQAFRAIDLAGRYFIRELSGSEGRTARDYLDRRGIRAETAQTFGLGLAPDSWDRLTRGMQRQGFRPEFLARLGLVAPREGRSGFYDRFRGRLMFPISDIRGRVVGFGGRALTDGQQPKYLNSPESQFFNKGHLLYGLHLAKDAIRSGGRAIIVEGYMDAIACHQAGIANVVASMGTALTVEQGRLLQQQTSEVTIAYDSDLAGAAATVKGMELLAGLGCRVRILRLEGGKDPDEYLQSFGSEAFLRQLESAETLNEYKLRLALGEPWAEPRTPEEKADAIKRVIPVLASIPDAVERGEYLKKVAALVVVKEDTVLQELKRTYRPRAAGSLRDRSGNSWHNNRDNRPESRPQATEISTFGGTKAERDLIAACLERPELIEVVGVRVRLEWFTDPTLAELASGLFSQGGGPGSINSDLQPFAITLLKELRAGFENEPVNPERLARRAEDCIRIMDEHRMVRRKAELETLFAESRKSGLDIPREVLKEYREIARKTNA